MHKINRLFLCITYKIVHYNNKLLTCNNKNGILITAVEITFHKQSALYGTKTIEEDFPYGLSDKEKGD